MKEAETALLIITSQAAETMVTPMNLIILKMVLNSLYRMSTFRTEKAILMHMMLP